ncbi:putative ATP-dependent RNA helicase DDX49 [Trichinella britovi]|uniref:RNA helicase n=1 Tax=Trichinella britovi TaxID=45882 RepID=A0A0V1DF68_TRIBR|nr:putative ATP-dependent RNA helicase DDX49 [Trichinella britovi]
MEERGRSPVSDSQIALLSRGFGCAAVGRLSGVPVAPCGVEQTNAHTGHEALLQAALQPGLPSLSSAGRFASTFIATATGISYVDILFLLFTVMSVGKIIKKETRTSLHDLGLSSWLVEQCAVMGIVEPSPVQLNCIPEILIGKDAIGCSKTGTGKTLAFAIPIIQRLSEDPYGIYALVLTPSRELAFQIGEQFQVLGKPLGLRTSIIVGGRDMIEQANEIANQPHILIATPGRLADHILSRSDENWFHKIKFFVLDEADRLLDGQYDLQLETIIEKLPKERQTLLFSATITDALCRLQELSVKKPFFWQEQSCTVTVDTLEQRYVLCPKSVKDAYVTYVVKLFTDKNPQSSVLIFSHSCYECQALTLMFADLGFKVGALHSMISQRERLSSFNLFKSNQLKILICTDVASRGLDLPFVDLVINHNIPAVAKTYIHRVGRSARAGRSGRAVTFITQYDIALLQAIEKAINCQMNELKVNDKKVSNYVTEVLVAKREAILKMDEQHFGERRAINRRKEMILSGLDPEDVDRFLERRKDRKQSKDKSDMSGSLKRKKLTLPIGSVCWQVIVMMRRTTCISTRKE